VAVGGDVLPTLTRGVGGADSGTGCDHVSTFPLVKCTGLGVFATERAPLRGLATTNNTGGGDGGADSDVLDAAAGGCGCLTAADAATARSTAGADATGAGGAAFNRSAANFASKSGVRDGLALRRTTLPTSASTSSRQNGLARMVWPGSIGGPRGAKLLSASAAILATRCLCASCARIFSTAISRRHTAHGPCGRFASHSAHGPTAAAAAEAAPELPRLPRRAAGEAAASAPPRPTDAGSREGSECAMRRISRASRARCCRPDTRRCRLCLRAARAADADGEKSVVRLDAADATTLEAPPTAPLARDREAALLSVPRPRSRHSSQNQSPSGTAASRTHPGWKPRSQPSHSTSVSPTRASSHMAHCSSSATSSSPSSSSSSSPPIASPVTRPQQQRDGSRLSGVGGGAHVCGASLLVGRRKQGGEACMWLVCDRVLCACVRVCVCAWMALQAAACVAHAVDCVAHRPNQSRG
jgi:hypothetical protein